MRVMISGGGTGGHIYPALAIVEQIRQTHPQAEFVYVGSSRGLEKGLVQQAAIPTMRFEALEVSGFRRSLSLENMKTVWRFVRAVSQCKQWVRAFRPDVVIGTGGYVCAPVVYAAAREGVATVIHEQNAIAGLTNRFLSRFVDAVAVSFRGTEVRFPAAKRSVYTGNPRASQVRSGDAVAARARYGIANERKLIVVVGGSRGALAVNEAVRAWLPMIAERDDLHVLVVSGDRYYDAWKASGGTFIADKGRLDWSKNVTVVPYVHDMPDVLAAATLAIGRAGASSLAEWTALGVPVILIPSPNVTANHQEENARALVNVGAAAMILERNLTAQRLHEAVTGLTDHPQALHIMRSASLKVGQADAAERVWQLIQEVSNTRT